MGVVLFEYLREDGFCEETEIGYCLEGRQNKKEKIMHRSCRPGRF